MKKLRKTDGSSLYSLILFVCVCVGGNSINKNLFVIKKKIKTLEVKLL